MMWKEPWTLKEGIAIGAGLTVVGLLLQLTVGGIDWNSFGFPVNVVLLVVFIAVAVALYLLRRKSYGIRFLTSPYSGVASLIFAVVFTALMGLTRQVPSGMPQMDKLGLTRMLSFWPFVLIYIWMALILSQVVLKSLMSFQWRKLPVFLFHLGLLIVLLCASLGSSDMQRLKMTVGKDTPEWRAFDDMGTIHELPIAIQLLDFNIEEYPPRLLLVDNDSGTVVETENLGGWRVDTLKKMEESAPMMTRDTTYYISWREPGNVRAWLVRATSPDGKTVKQGWLTCGSYRFPMQLLKVSQQYSIAMAEPEPMRYLSQVQILTKTGKNIFTDIEVNHPFTVDGWKIYQYSYDEKMGKWSDVSVLELVRDPWLPAVYFGILLLALGSIGFFFTSSSRKKSLPLNSNSETT
ncbi:MAG: cytochrome c biogenesis protein ResB [Prevotella sp.]|jgi:hypothetical protein